MTISRNESTDGNEITIVLEERFDFHSIKDFRESYAENERNNITFIIDMAKTKYMDSSALGMLLNMKKYLSGMEADIHISNCSEQIKKIFMISRFDKKFTFDD